MLLLELYLLGSLLFFINVKAIGCVSYDFDRGRIYLTTFSIILLALLTSTLGHVALLLMTCSKNSKIRLINTKFDLDADR